MSDEEVRRFVADIFNNSESIKQWREAAELAREERLRRAKLLRRAVELTVLREKYDEPQGEANEAWQAYYDSL